MSKAAIATLSDTNIAELNKYKQQLQLKAYSPSTINTYVNEFMQLLKLLNNTVVNTLTVDDLKRFMHYSLTVLKVSENTAHSRINAIKFYYEQVLKKEKFFWEIPRPKKTQQLPGFFNTDEITDIIKSTNNVKHKTMLMLSYSTGMRVSEVISIKVQHIDSKRMQILIKAAKGKKDRMVKLSPVLLVMLREYYKAYKPAINGYLFCGQDGHSAYSTRSMQ